MTDRRWWCSLHGDYSNDRVVSFSSDEDENGKLIADQCGQCICEAEGVSW